MKTGTDLGTDFALRLATEEDIPALNALIEASVRGLQADDYTQARIEGALGNVLGLDTQLIRDRTCFVADAFTSTRHAQTVEDESKPLIAERR